MRIIFPKDFDRVLALLLDDIEEAYIKSRCVAVGIKAIYGLDVPVPPIPPIDPPPPTPTPAYLDSLVLWARKAMREVERLNYDEVDFDFVLSALAGSPVTGDAQYTLEQFTNEMKTVGSGSITLDLSAQFAAYEYVRTRAVGVSFGWLLQPEMPARDYKRLYRICCVVTPPNQGNEWTPSYQRPPVVMGYVDSFYRDRPVTMEAGVAIKNLNP